MRSGVRRDAAAILPRVPVVADPVAPNVSELDNGDNRRKNLERRRGRYEIWVRQIGRTQPMKKCVRIAARSFWSASAPLLFRRQSAPRLSSQPVTA